MTYYSLQWDEYSCTADHVIVA